MSQLILDMGSGNTCKNDKKIIETMIRQVAEIATDKHEVILKWQLFQNAPPNIPLTKESFEYAYRLGNNLCFKTTSSVFDVWSMKYLMGFDVPFVKIACRPELYELAKYSSIPVYVSTSETGIEMENVLLLACIPEYPATIEQYENTFNTVELNCISDHTVGWKLYHKYQPQIIEKHYVHERNADNPDAGPFAVTQKELACIM